MTRQQWIDHITTTTNLVPPHLGGDPHLWRQATVAHAEAGCLACAERRRTQAWVKQRIQLIGERACKAVRAAAAIKGGKLTTEVLELAASWLEIGDRRAGINRPWPQLASRLRIIAPNI